MVVMECDFEEEEEESSMPDFGFKPKQVKQTISPSINFDQREQFNGNASYDIDKVLDSLDNSHFRESVKPSSSERDFDLSMELPGRKEEPQQQEEEVPLMKEFSFNQDERIANQQKADAK